MASGIGQDLVSCENTFEGFGDFLVCFFFLFNHLNLLISHMYEATKAFLISKSLFLSVHNRLSSVHEHRASSVLEKEKSSLNKSNRFLKLLSVWYGFMASDTNSIYIPKCHY